MSARRPAAVVALLAAGGAATALFLAGGSPAKPGAGGAAATSGTATIQRRDLVATDTEPGTVGHAAQQTVYDRLSGTITWLPQVGQAIKPGGVLFRVDGRPVILMDGTTPAFRDLAPGTGDGEDVTQLNRELVALGFDPDGIAIDDEWQTATTAGVEELQRSLGESETGRLTLGEVAFLPGEQLVSAVDATLGGDGGGGGSGSPSANSVGDLGAGRREYASFEQAPPTAPPEPAAGGRGSNPGRRPAHGGSGRVHTLEAQLTALQAEVDRLRAQGATGREPGGAGSPKTGGSEQPGAPTGGASATPILTTTSTQLVVKVSLEAGKQDEARIGRPVSVLLPDGETVGGTITAVSPVAQSASTSPPAEDGGEGQGGGAGPGGSSSTIPVTIALHGRHPAAGLDQAQVSVEFVQAVARNVLSVPVTALLATGGARYAVQEATPPHRLIPVATGLFAAGDVQVSGRGVHPGIRVSDSQG